MHLGSHFSKHAQKRLQQRAIPPVVMTLLEQFGSEFRSGGDDSLVFDAAAKKRLRKGLGGPRGMKTMAIDKWLDVYAIVANDGTLITAGRRYSRIIRP